MKENKKENKLDSQELITDPEIANSINEKYSIKYLEPNIGSYLLEEPFVPHDFEFPKLSLDAIEIGSRIFDGKIKLEQEITTLKEKLSITSKEVDKEAKKGKKEIEELKKEIEHKEKINHIIPRVCSEARKKLLEEEEFQDLFKDSKTCDSVVISLDIRRSTELMLKAKKPELFSKFITELTSKLSEVILANYGIFDKFTGDGILAFFPKFYSGEEAILRALKAARECHVVFKDHYYQSRNCFNVFIKDIGLGIGVDYGKVTLVNARNELTVVGIPVVYACRMSSAKAGDTLLNQSALEELKHHSKNDIKISENELFIKNEGTALVYKAEVLRKLDNLKKPDWLANEQ